MQLKFDEKGLICAVAQDCESGEVLMQAYMNLEAYEKTLETGYAHYYSRSRQKLWKKGEESGHLQEVVSVSLDCDGDCVLLRVRQTGAACHTGNYSCFFNTVKEGGAGAEMLGRLQRVVEDRRDRPEEGSYTCYLFEKGVDKIAKKTGEEAVELVIAAKNGDKEEIVGECADLFYHTLVLLANAGVKLSDVCAELEERHS
ncbi:bifunctional phosphoribosyl-AMP cyclohydrolase/phosphoribosyl-ATP diphosphatase HisIE [Candidatus Borkfalkia ceftriaxoniphila]|jgi:histidine biosynthesis bifunctional protein hisIE|uniref:Histidine biosynthesis bifunctional protein HisIE n=1 Tax=Candidatus Borkfalkia ceftriaxoniphila TaxID=2508949 RepID=A0A4Q2KD96_9FIRM|nr:bifunctional phosphoribosyl-AMP cyclohydrolase/phosphoribosyl-ATP diphosphatase HisIE [Candidatus Borkfalkia ceftriaxoniphila]RXZ61999.1 bifunctional phosphoribosyl-AMP cyclohydrolase/phosphoribosyl-ATP diphosphatase HisIE [Candidatus Borkfalkia ceftriaxoniphila]